MLKLELPYILLAVVAMVVMAMVVMAILQWGIAIVSLTIWAIVALYFFIDEIRAKSLDLKMAIAITFWPLALLAFFILCCACLREEDTADRVVTG